MNKNEKAYRKKLLLSFINIYLSKKDIKMKDLLVNLDKTLKTKGKISLKQLNAIIKFIERERPFKGRSRKEIYDYFEPFISDYHKESKNASTTLYGL